MAARQGAITMTASRWSPETVRGRHMFEVTGYSLLKGLGAGKFIRSATFDVGGHGWAIRFYPDGHDGDDKEYKDYVAIYLELVRRKTEEATAIYKLRLVNWVSSDDVSSLVEFRSTRAVFSTLNQAYGKHKFLKRSILEASSEFLRDDCLAIECDMTVIMGATTHESEMICDIQVPPSDFLEDLGKLLESGEGADVAFNVDGEVFHAHKFLLALRSPVFKAELCGPMSNNNTRSVIVEDMQPVVFKMLLHYIYKDTLPAIDDRHGADEVKDAIKHLLVAADRYGMERMKLLCERFLCKTLDSENVANILSLADQHHCNKLKEACIQFINSSNKIDNVISSRGYEHLRSACPAVFVDMWEKSAKSRKIQ